MIKNLEQQKTKLRRLKYNLKHIGAENIVLILAIVFCLFCTVQSISAMQKNWTLSDTLAETKQQLTLITLETEAAELENEYYASDEYQELAARKSANRQLEGEHLVYLPENSEEAKNKHKDSTDATTTTEKTYSNFDLWMKFIFQKS